MGLIKLGSCELLDSEKFKLECDIYISQFGYFPDLSIVINDALIPSTKKLEKDPAVLAGVSAFLKSIGYEGEMPQKLSSEENILIAEVDEGFISFAESKGWFDISKNIQLAKKHALLSLSSEESPIRSVVAIDDNRYRAEGNEFLIVEFDKLSEVVKAGAINNAIKLPLNLLAEHCSYRLSEDFEERKKLIESKQSELGRAEFADWIKGYLTADKQFFLQLAQVLDRDELYRVTLLSKVFGTTEHFIIFEAIK